MIEVLLAVGPALGSIAAVIMLCPQFIVRQYVRLYPKDDPRRRELVAEVYAVPTRDRLSWVIDQLLLAGIEGPRLRRQLRLTRQLNKRLRLRLRLRLWMCW